MFKSLFAILLSIISGIFGLNKIKNVDLRNQLAPAPTVTETQTVTKTPTTSALVPLPTAEDIIRTFFELINEKRIPEAINMMSKNAVPDDTHKQGYGVTFNQFQSIKVMNIKESMKEEWTDDRQTYMVNLDVMIKPDSNQAILWDDGENTRFVSLIKENNLWKIDGLATGP